MKKQVFIQLLDKYLSGKASSVEESLLVEYYNRLDEQSEAELSEKEAQALNELILKNIRLEISKGNQRRSKLRSIRRWYGAAASVLLLLSIGTYIFLHRPKVSPQLVQNRQQDIAPGGDKAVLTLSNGSSILLSNAPNGQLASQGSSKILKTTKGQLEYQIEAGRHPVSDSNSFNTLSTPRGGEYRLVLSDGTKVWLNAASSIKYPVAFTGKERVVEITGEAYFEVIHNAAQPFRVKVGNIEIADIGTHFDVFAYKDEPTIRATLLEGSIKVSNGQNSVVLNPDQQVQVTNDYIKVIDDVDQQQVIAWQRGLFEFDNTGLAAIMRQISRWYNVDIVYQHPPSDKIFGGGINKNQPLSNVLKLLEANGVNFKLEGRTLIVNP